MKNTKQNVWVWLALLCCMACCGRLTAAHSAIYTVGTTVDSDDGACGEICSLRDAIESVNAGTGAGDTINFGLSGTGPFTISLTSALPAIIQPVTINGYSQLNAKVNTQAAGDNAVLEIVVDGTNAGGKSSGFFIQAANTTIEGLVIQNFKDDGIFVDGDNNGSSATITGNFIGTDVTGTTAAPNGFNGIELNDSANNVIGGGDTDTDLYANRNIIAGNGGDGIFIQNSGATGNTIQGNYIGTNAAGTAALGNGSIGVDVESNGNTVGGTTIANRNVISGNAGDGIDLSSASNTVQNNYVGTNATGTAALGNTNDGIYVTGVNSGNSDNFISNNLVAGNGANGIELQDGVQRIAEDKIKPRLAVAANAATVQGNYIGTNAAGTAALPNGADGIYINGADNTLIGGAGNGQGNLISGNSHNGIELVSSNSGLVLTSKAQTGATAVLVTTRSTGSNTTVQGNLIGTNAAGTAALPNGADGIYVNGVDNTLIGGASSGQGNLISGNAGNGIETVSGSNLLPALKARPHAGASRITPRGTGSSTTIQGNMIGTNAAGTAALPNATNGTAGILIQTDSNTIGGTNTGDGNLISGNAGVGVSIKDNNAEASYNIVEGNFIGTNLAGIAALANTGDGVLISSTNNFTLDNAIGGTAAGAGNTIAFNGGNGVTVVGSEAYLNPILSNSIFSNAKLGIDLGNDGVTPNDALDADSGPNDLQNFPVLTAASSSGGNTTITGSLDSGTNISYRIEFFASDAIAPSGYGEGQTFIGFTTVTTDGTGHADFTAALNGVTLASGQFVTSTATSLSQGNDSIAVRIALNLPQDTSEFSQAAAADLSITNTDNPDPVDAGGTLTYTLSVTNNGPSTAATVTVTDTLPAGTTYVSATSADPAWTITYNATTNTVTATRPNLPATAPVAGSKAKHPKTATVKPRAFTAPGIVITVKAPSAGGLITNTATVSSPTGDANLANNTVIQTTTVTAVADLSITGSATPNPVKAGATLTYTLNVSNAGPSAASTVSVLDTLPTGATFVSAAGTGWTFTPNGAGTTVTATRPTLAVGAAPAITITSTAPAPQASAASGTLTATATVSSATKDSNAANNTATITTTVQSIIADVAVTQTAAPTTVTVGNNVTYTITVTNNGPATATGVKLTDVLPTGVTFVSASPAPATNSGGTLTFTLGTLTSGTNTVVSVVAQTTKAGTFTNTTSVTADQTDSNPANNTATAMTTVTASADLALALSGPASSVAVGSDLTYTLTVTNKGPSPASNVTLTDNLPAGVNFVSSSPVAAPAPAANAAGPLSLTFNLGTLASGATSTITIVATAAPSGAGNVTDAANVTATESDPNGANNSASVTTTITSLVDLGLRLTGPTAANLGDTLTYTLKVTNPGPSPATGVVITDTLPSGLSFVSATPTQSSANPLTFKVGTLAIGTTATITFKVKVTATQTGVVKQTATVKSTETDANAGDNTATLSTTLVSGTPPATDLSLTLTATPSPVAVGQKLSYTLALDNNGPHDAPGVVVTDTFPVGVQLDPTSVTIRTAAGAPITFIPTVSLVGRTLTVGLGTLKHGTGLVVTADVTILATAGSVVTDTASVQSGINDSNPDNNDATVQTKVTPVADLAVTTTQPSHVDNGQNLTFQITVTNNGPSTASNVGLTESIAALSSGKATFVSASPAPTTRQGAFLTFSLGSLALHAQAHITVVIKPTVVGSLAGRAAVSSATADPNSVNNTATQQTNVTAAADLAVSVTHFPDPTIAGAVVTFKITVSNAGPSAAPNTKLIYTLPAGLVFVTSSPTSANANGARAFNLGTIASGGQTKVILYAHATRQGNFTSKAAVSSAVDDPRPVNNTVTVQSSIAAGADLAVTNSSSLDSTIVGSNVDYTLVVTNNGPSAATNVTLKDVWPTGLSFVSANASQGNFTHSTGLITFNLGTIAVGATVTARVTLNPTNPGTTTNTATVSATEGDPDLTNNTASKNTTAANGTPSFNVTSNPPVLSGNGNGSGGGYLPGLFTGNRAFTQQVTIVNNQTSPVSGPIALVLVGLSGNTTLTNATGTTGGNPYITLNLGSDKVFSPGESVTVTLVFQTTDANINYTAKVVQGTLPS